MIFKIYFFFSQVTLLHITFKVEPTRLGTLGYNIRTSIQFWRDPQWWKDSNNKTIRYRCLEIHIMCIFNIYISPQSHLVPYLKWNFKNPLTTTKILIIISQLLVFLDLSADLYRKYIIYFTITSDFCNIFYINNFPFQ